MVCNGHYNTPAFPEYPGQDIFKGRQIHSHDYRCAAPFKCNETYIFNVNGFQLFILFVF